MLLRARICSNSPFIGLSVHVQGQWELTRCQQFERWYALRLTFHYPVVSWTSMHGMKTLRSLRPRSQGHVVNSFQKCLRQSGVSKAEMVFLYSVTFALVSYVQDVLLSSSLWNYHSCPSRADSKWWMFRQVPPHETPSQMKHWKNVFWNVFRYTLSNKKDIIWRQTYLVHKFVFSGQFSKKVSGFRKKFSHLHIIQNRKCKIFTLPVWCCVKVLHLKLWTCVPFPQIYVLTF